MTSLFSQRKVGENDRCVFYQTSVTDDVDQWAAERGLSHRCLRASLKRDGGCEPGDLGDFILVLDGEVVFASQRAEEVAARLDMVYMSEKKEGES